MKHTADHFSPDFASAYERISELVGRANDDEDFAALNRALLDAIRGCHSAGEIWSLLSIEQIGEATFVEAEFPPEIATALLSMAEAWGETPDAASVISLAIRASAYDTAPALCTPMDEMVKEDFARVVEARLDRFAAGVSSDCPAYRAACAHAVGRCRGANAAHARMLLDGAELEADDSARGAMLIAAGSIARRRAAAGVLDLVLPEWRPDPSRFVAACRAVVVALAGRPMSSSVAEALASAVAAPIEMPEAWGWGWYGNNGTTVLMGERIFAWADVRAPAAPIAAFGSVETPTGRAVDSVIHLAFADGAAIPEWGLVSSELTKEQADAVRVFAKPMPDASPWLQRFYLTANHNVVPFLEARPPAWKLLHVEFDGRRQWHLWRIWRAVLWQGLDTAVAARTIVEGLEPEGLLDVLTRFDRGVQVKLTSLTPADEARDARLTAAVVESCSRREPNILTILEKLATDKVWRAGSTLAVAILAASRALRTGVPESLDPTLKDGYRRTSAPEVFDELLDVLPVERRVAILKTRGERAKP